MKSDLVGSLFGSFEPPSGPVAGLVALGLDTTASAYVAVAGSLLVAAKKPQASALIFPLALG